MLKLISSLFILLICFQTEIICQPGSFKQSALLDSTQAYILVNQCSRYSPVIDGIWNPSGKQIEDLENNISKVYELTAEKCCLVGEKLHNVNDFLRQYVGIVVQGEKLIYINAFPKNTFDDWPADREKPDWKVTPYMVCDGGSSFWGVVYNPKTGKFQQLAFNGVG